MGSAVSAVEKAAVSSLLQLEKRTGTELNEADLTALLWWCWRKRFITQPDQLFNLNAWEQVRKKLWNGITVKNKEAIKHALVWRTVTFMVEQLQGEAQITAAARRAIEEAGKSLNGKEQEKVTETKKTDSLLPETLACRATRVEKEFWGGPEINIAPWNSPEPPPPPPLSQLPPPSSSNSPSRPVLPSGSEEAADLSKVLLPMEIDEWEGKPQRYPDLVNKETREVVRAQERAMRQLLGEMQQLDARSKKTKIKEAYSRAHKAVVEGLQAVEAWFLGEEQPMQPTNPFLPSESVKPSAPPPEPAFAPMSDSKKRKWVIECVKDREMSIEEADNYLQSQFGPDGKLTMQEIQAIVDWWNVLE